MKTNRIKRLISYVAGVLALLVLAGCGQTDASGDGNVIYYYPKETQETENEKQEEQELYAIVSIDTASGTIRLYRYANRMAYQYYYTLDTDFVDRYGNYDSAADFVPGKVVYIDQVDEEGCIGRIQIADNVWEYSGVEKFSVDEERGIFYIADTKYNYDDELYVFSDKSLSDLSELTENDILTVIGKDKKILSIMVTTGHGRLQLLNTGLFEDSYLQLDTSYFVTITSNMTMELPEGDYTLSVANDGWGGSTDITIRRGETTTVDLDTLKGEGPQYGNILFLVDLEDAVVRVDGEKISIGTPVKLRYGWHALVVSSSEYDDWSKRLYVNSKEATISIDLDDGTLDAMENDSGGAEDESAEVETEAATETEEGSGGKDTETTEKSEGNLTSEDVMEDYLSTLTEMLDSL